ncbi:MAG: hypothetical protein ABSE49_30790 [Polyangiaceae bacterium]|jgi:hypothetical protein
MRARSTRWAAAASASLALALAAWSARAQTGGDAAGAQALFEQGKALMAAGKYDEACPKLADSERLDPGGGTLLALALCHEGQGRTATAWADFHVAESAARRDGRPDREKAAQDHIRALEPLLARLTITVTQPAADLRVTRDGTVVGASEWGTPLPLDPGPHTVEAAAPGKSPWSASVSVQPQADLEVKIPPLQDAVAATPVPLPVIATPIPASPPPSASPGSSPGGQRVLGLAVGGAGVVGLALGVAFGLESFAHWSSARNACPGLTCTSGSAAASGQQASNEAKSAADVSTVAFVAGGVALAAGAVLFFTAPSRAGTSEGASSLRLAPFVARGGGGGGFVLDGAL